MLESPSAWHYLNQQALDVDEQKPTELADKFVTLLEAVAG